MASSRRSAIWPPSLNNWRPTLNLQGGYQDRPTISYQPQTGSQFIRNLTNPINPGSVLFLLQSGYPADIVFDLTVDTINGLKNRSVSGGQLRPADPEFTRMVQAMRKAQISGHVGIRVQHEKEKQDSVTMFFQDKNIDPELARELAEVRKILGLDPSTRANSESSSAPRRPTPMRSPSCRARSSAILSELSTFVDVPVEHQVSGIAPPIGEAGINDQPPFRVLSCAKKPHDPFVAVCYEGQWFWIEKSDFRSKRTLSYLLVLLALSDTGVKENLPVITIQAN